MATLTVPAEYGVADLRFQHSSSLFQAVGSCCMRYLFHFVLFTDLKSEMSHTLPSICILHQSFATLCVGVMRIGQPNQLVTD